MGEIKVTMSPLKNSIDIHMNSETGIMNKFKTDWVQTLRKNEHRLQFLMKTISSVHNT